jgi:hypothetical protein
MTEPQRNLLIDHYRFITDTRGWEIPSGGMEPGETVNVRPAWRNHLGAPQTFTGTLTGITGPAGARRAS